MATIPPADFLIHAANLMMLAAYSVRDILWLRSFAVAASLISIPYFLVQTNTLWPPVLWGTVFVLINLYQIVRIYLERRPVVLSADERQLYDFAFRALRPREFVSLLLAGRWQDAAPGDSLLRAGEPASVIGIAISGRVRVEADGREIAVLEPGQLIGTALALTGDVSPVDAVFVERGRYMAWPLETLRVFLDKRPETRATLQRTVNLDLAQKVERMGRLIYATPRKSVPGA